MNDTAGRVWEALLPEDRPWLQRLRSLAPLARTAVVGGAVRDALLGLHPPDLDVVVQGAYVRDVAATSGLPFTYHPQYDNATLTLPDGRHLDLIHARTEAYARPGAAPTVHPGTLEQDLARRDFTVNAMALELHEDQPRLLDPHGGQADLRVGLLRPLHDRSFADDASRLARAARLGARLNLDLSPEGSAQVPLAREYGPLTPRLKLELPLCFHEPRPGRVFERLARWGAPDLMGAPAVDALAALDRARDAGTEVPLLAYEAAWLAAQTDPHEAARDWHLSERALGLLERARSDRPYPEGSPEAILRDALGVRVTLPAISGADVVALGVRPGPLVGRALEHVARLRRAGLAVGRDQELAELRAYLRACSDR